MGKDSVNSDLVIYHANCVDGFTAAWIVWSAGHANSCEYYPAQYSDKEVDLPDVIGRNVYMVDFSLKRPQMLDVIKKAASVKVFDHHKTAKAELAGIDGCVFDITKSGAMLAYEFFKPSYVSLDFVKYVQDRDLWQWALYNSKEINAYIQNQEKTFSRWEAINSLMRNPKSTPTSGGIPYIIDVGKQLLNNTANYIAYMKTLVQIKRDLQGRRVALVNSSGWNASDLLGELTEGVDYVVGWFVESTGKIVYQLRSNGKVDVAEVAKDQGGGGHKNAAGFMSEHNPRIFFLDI